MLPEEVLAASPVSSESRSTGNRRLVKLVGRFRISLGEIPISYGRFEISSRRFAAIYRRFAVSYRKFERS